MTMGVLIAIAVVTLVLITGYATIWYRKNKMLLPHQKIDSKTLGASPDLIPRDWNVASELFWKGHHMAMQDVRAAVENNTQHVEYNIRNLSGDTGWNMCRRYSLQEINFLIMTYENECRKYYDRYARLNMSEGCLAHTRKESLAQISRKREALEKLREIDGDEDLAELNKLIEEMSGTSAEKTVDEVPAEEKVR